MSTTTDDMKQFSVGTQWKIKNLTSETGKKFNGKTCVIVATFDVTTGRVGVRIKNARNKGRQQLNIKPINLHADQSTTQMEGVKETTPQEAEDAEDVEDCPQEAEDVEDCPQEEEDKEDCPICCDALPKLSSQFTRLICCGKGLHDKCAKDLMENTSMTLEQKNTCIMCRAKDVADGSKEDIERLRIWVKKGKAWAMDMLGCRYEVGLGVKQSDIKAIELYEKAAKRGNATAQYNLGLYYHQGSHGLTQSSKRAIEYYTLAVEQGHTSAQFNLGVMYANGDGIEQSDKKAIELYEMAAKRGHADAQYNLGHYYNLGSHGLTQSSKRAIELYILAAEQGHADAHSNLGVMYASGEGVEQSFSKARELWTKAAAQGSEDAIQNLKIMDEKEGVKSTTTPPEVVDASIISCSTCGKQQTKEFRLGKCVCRTKRYCNSQCQKKQYKQHKKECLRLVKERKNKKNGQNMKEDGTKDGTKEKPLQEEGEEDCPICIDALPKLDSHFVRLGCCGKGLHNKCYADLVATECMTKNTCLMCRSQWYAPGSKEGIERLRNWVKKGTAWAMGMLAERYREGVGVKQSDTKTVELFKMAAKRGHARSQYNLGVYYRQGMSGVTQSSKKAFEYYKLAAEQGHAMAQYNVGVMYAQGEGIETSYSKARVWVTKAAAQGFKKAIDVLKELDQHG